MIHIKLSATLGALFGLLGGCGYVDAYEEAVYDEEPIYCYKSLANVECFKEPHDRDRAIHTLSSHALNYIALQKKN